MAIVPHTSSSLYVDTDRAYALDELERMKSSASSDRFGVHSTTDDLAIADIILFVERSFLFTRDDTTF